MARTLTIITTCLFILTGCASTGTSKPQVISSSAKSPSMRQATKVKGTQRPYKIKGKKYYPLPSAEGFSQKGVASWYGKPFHGRKTSNGETYNMYKLSAAHKTLPMGTNLLVTNLDNGRKLTVRVNDRGPFVRGRIIDLSYKAAKEMGMLKKGTARVRIAALGEAVTVHEKGRKVEKFLPHQDFNYGDFYIQIGAFADKNNAARLKRKMEKRGYKVTSRPFRKGGTRFTRIRIKAGDDLRHATKMVKRFRSEGFKDSFVAAR
ncbi:MAG: septal ring lytic transglycosylase RlpA family protein [Thermodesulfobacteriota bacterium]